MAPKKKPSQTKGPAHIGRGLIAAGGVLRSDGHEETGGERLPFPLHRGTLCAKADNVTAFFRRAAFDAVQWARIEFVTVDDGHGEQFAPVLIYPAESGREIYGARLLYSAFFIHGRERDRQ